MSIYWYWISDNISREGVIKDLEAMKKIGITKAIIANVGLSGIFEIPYGNTKLFSREWWEIMHTALKTAGELDIEIGIYNCPGWSSSGGPWIRPEQSMRYLTASEIQIKGPAKISTTLVQPTDIFQDVKVLAFKVPKNFDKKISPGNTRITSAPLVNGIEHLIDGRFDTEVSLPDNKPMIVDFETTDSITIRSIIIYPAEKPVMAGGELFIRKNGQYHSIRSFRINRSNPKLQVGFDPFGAISISVSPTVSDAFRLVISNTTPEAGIKEIFLTESPRVESYIEKSLAKTFQQPQPTWFDYQWPQQPEADDPELLTCVSEVYDISEYMSPGGILTWDVPEGEWIIMRSGMAPCGVKNQQATPEGSGLEVDKMTSRYLTHHFDSFMGEIIRRIPAEDRKSLKFVGIESWEVGSQNWTDEFIKCFKERFSYDPIPFIPVLKGYVIGSRDLSDRFLWDLRRFIADRVAYEYIGGLRKVCNDHGLTLWIQNYGHWGFPGEFLQYGGQSDEISGEFWIDRELGDIECRAASSAAHIYGKKKVSAESFTDVPIPFTMYPEKMKRSGDRAFTEGINDTYLLVYFQQPYDDDKRPGVNSPAGPELNRHNTWFYELEMFIDYMKRANFILQQGRYVADVAYFIGENAPVMTGNRDPELPRGYSFDYINAEVIESRLSVKNGNLILPDGMSYRILVLPKSETMRPELLRKIRDLVNQGAVVLGSPPSRSPSLKNYPDADEEVRLLANELWKDVDGIQQKYARFGKGMIISGMMMQEALNLINIIPDCRFAAEDTVLFIHRTSDDTDIYFITNQSDQTVVLNPEFRIRGKVPELWDAVNGTIRVLQAYFQKEESTIVPVKLEPYESAFIVFRKKGAQAVSNDISGNYPDPEILLEVDGPWKVVFDPRERGPVEAVTFEKLIDWRTSQSDSIKYYSGRAIYQTTFKLNELRDKERLFLNLGKLVAVARIRVNGLEAGGVWTSPWQVDISNLVKTGHNLLEIEVVNNWVNRLIGDSQLPVNKRKTWAYTIWLTEDEQLQSSGLLGPVTIQAVRYNGSLSKPLNN